MKRPAVLLAVFLFAVTAALITYRVVRLEYPLFPASAVRVWQLSIEGLVEAGQKEMDVAISLPYTHGGQTVTEERITSGGLDFTLLRQGVNRSGEWSGKTGPAGAVIGYRAIVLLKPSKSSRTRPMPAGPYPPSFSEGDRELASRIADRWSRLPVMDRIHAISATASGKWGDPAPDPSDVKMWSKVTARVGRATALQGLFRAADLPAQVTHGLILAESVTRETVRMVEAWTGTHWAYIEPDTGTVYEKSLSFLPLTTGDISPVRVSRGSVPEVRWDLRQQVVSQWSVYFDRIRQPDKLLNRWSLFSLPPEFQATFRILLLVPIGALMVCILRNIIGFPTFGIFMPVLMALAFRSTGLDYGLAIFTGVILVGYVMRSVLDKLHLLLVPRLSVILTAVIGCFTFLAVLGNKLGVRELMAVGLLPFVILTMMIERFFVIVEEAGIQEGLRNAAGSAAVAAITHAIIHIQTLQLTFFVYPELLLALAALQILLGRYTGYRVSELVRFRALRKE